MVRPTTELAVHSARNQIGGATGLSSNGGVSGAPDDESKGFLIAVDTRILVLARDVALEILPALLQIDPARHPSVLTGSPA